MAIRYLKKMIGRATQAVLITSLLVCAPLYSQVAGSTLTGIVTDPTGAVIPNAQVSIKNTATGIVTNYPANSAGLYTAPNLIPGPYQITVSAKGFETEVRSGITLTVGAQQVLNVALHVGQTTQTIRVSGQAPIVQLATSSISATVNSTTVRQLPLNGRDWTQLALLQPGVVSVRTPVTLLNNGTARGLGMTMSVSGMRPNQNNYRLDGISVNDYSNTAPGSVLGQDLGVDSIQEFSVLTSNYSAEYGKTSGGVINAITKSGTNQFHGDVYEFLRNSNLDAANFFDNASNVTEPPFRRNQFGVSAGGPIRKDNTFVFGDYEGLRQALTTTTVDVVPSAAARSGNLSTGQITVDPSVQRFINAFYPLPNGPSLGDTGIFSTPINAVTPENFFTTRLDHTFSQKDSIFGTYLYDYSTLTQPDEFHNKTDAFRSQRTMISLEETHIFSPQLVNALRFGYNRSMAWGGLTLPLNNPAASDLSFGTVPGHTAAQAFVPGLTIFTGGVGGPSNQFFVLNAFQAYDDAFLTRGDHSLKFGFAFERDQNDMTTHLYPNAQVSFGSLPSFLIGQVSSFTAILPTVPITPRDLRQSILGGYFQDDWRVRPNLTMNLGLRYEMATVPTEVHGELSTLLHPTDVQPHLGSPFFSNPTYRNFEPRVGFAWDPFHTGKTSVRGAFGVFDVLPLTYQDWETTFDAAPFTQNGTASNLPAHEFPAGIFSSVSGNPSTLSQQYMQPNPQRNYVMEWNTSIQRELAPNLTMMVSYVGSRAVHNPFISDSINIVSPTLTSQGYLWPSPAGSGTVTNPNVGQIRTYQWESSSSYNGLELQVTKAMSHGLQLQGSYTWSKTIDTSSASRVEDQFNNSFTALPFWNMGLNRGLADFNVGQNLVINYIWQIPAPKFTLGAARWLLTGWQLGGIYEASTGVPFFLNMGGDPLGQNNSDPFDVPNRLVGPGCNSLVNPGNPNNYIKTQCLAFPNPSTLRGNLGRNTLTGPGLSDFDFSLFKNFNIKRISENFNAQVRAEFFNVLNRANFSPPLDNITAFDQFGNPVPGTGLIDSTQGAAREIQFALKLTW